MATTLYRLLTGPDDVSFCHKVSLALSKGWLLHGAPAYAYDSAAGRMMCAQAVVKDIDGAYDPAMKLGEH
jgi:hypothetical protein